jgi:hypothetical protein
VVAMLRPCLSASPASGVMLYVRVPAPMPTPTHPSKLAPERGSSTRSPSIEEPPSRRQVCFVSASRSSTSTPAARLLCSASFCRLPSSSHVASRAPSAIVSKILHHARPFSVVLCKAAPSRPSPHPNVAKVPRNLVSTASGAMSVFGAGLRLGLLRAHRPHHLCRKYPARFLSPARHSDPACLFSASSSTTPSEIQFRQVNQPTCPNLNSVFLICSAPFEYHAGLSPMSRSNRAEFESRWRPTFFVI